MSRPEWTRGGVRWLGLRRDGAGEHAERVVFSASGPAPQATSGTTSFAGVAPSIAGSARRACPPDMVHVTGRLCVDRYESQLVDAWGVALSPYHATSPQVVRQVLDEWTFGRLLVGDLHARAMPLPPLLRPVDSVVTPVATSRPGTVPTSQISGAVAEAACRSAGKRLCSLDEWTLACRGEEGREFPYGTAHEQGACNVNGDAHPAAVLHGNAALGHLDPRLNLVEIDGVPLLSTTGASPRCASRWGDDAIFDMVGNLDEWVDDEEGTFAGGFYARGTRRGCGSVITSHPRRYFDYSLGTRCCLTP
ncbi:MAG: SUMF1/EgtB/PvdO family nonheme iron enzyme [Deltaproteobacteria bacterium]|nr:SUMF1/EgtB/PvdO family nonheme iron enzyme [Deltaproteobacteria bacterium]